MVRTRLGSLAYDLVKTTERMDGISETFLEFFVPLNDGACLVSVHVAYYKILRYDDAILVMHRYVVAGVSVERG